MNNKNKIVAILSVSIFITVIIGFIFVYIFKNGDRRNYKDTSKWQITITYKELNIRESASTESSILGKVSQGEIYDVMDYAQDSTYYWYKISTKDGITGYVGSKIDDPYVKESGAIKKSDLSIKYYHNYAVFKDDTYNTDEVECISTYGCTITYELLADNYIKYIATDTLGKSVYKTQKYYMTYSMKDYEYENNNFRYITKFERDEDGVYVNLCIINKHTISKSYIGSYYKYTASLYEDFSNTVSNEHVLTGNGTNTSINDFKKLSKGLSSFTLDKEDISAYSNINLDYFIPYSNNYKYFIIGFNTDNKNLSGYTSYQSRIYILD